MRASAPPPSARAALSSALLCAVFATGCRVGPDYHTPDLSPRTDPPWRAPSGPVLMAERAELATWWSRLGSPELEELAGDLCSQNLSLVEARQRIVAARAERGIVNADRLPQVGGSADYVRTGTGEQSLNFQGPPPGRTLDLYSTSVTAAWELDLWGRVARLVEAADAGIDIAIEDYRAAAVSLLAELALAYIDASTLRQRLAVAERNVGLQQETVRLARSRLTAGTGTGLDVEQAERELELTRARLPALQHSLRAAENRIAVLVGERPRDDLVAARDGLALPPSIGLGLPADLLVRRADVRRAERTLAAAVARIGAAEAERYPRVSLSGRLALAASELGTFADGADAVSWSFGPGLTIPIFTGGRIDSRVRAREARAEEARVAFERTLLEAIGEVETAADGVVRTRERLARLQAAADAARRAVAHAQDLHAAGTRDLLQVIDAQRSLSATEDELWVARQEAFARTVDLYRALGGGWEPLALDGSIGAAPEAGRDRR